MNAIEKKLAQALRDRSIACKRRIVAEGANRDGRVVAALAQDGPDSLVFVAQTIVPEIMIDANLN